MVYSYLFPFYCLEHLDSLRLGHAKRQTSWVGLYYVYVLGYIQPVKMILFFGNFCRS